MGYRDRAVKAACGHCTRKVCWSDRSDRLQVAPGSWTCSCGYTNTVKLPEKWPNVPQYLFIGPDKLERLKVYATPPEHTLADWAQPWSIRSFMSQASAKYKSCAFTSERRGEVMGETVFKDRCKYYKWPSDDDLRQIRGPIDEEQFAVETDCHIVAGWSTGVDTCPLWKQIAQLCQTEIEQKFLHHYLRYVKDRQFPMLIPQPRIGVAERRRPDFVLFLPLQHWNYQWMAIELDGAHLHENASNDEARDAELAAHGYDVFSVRPTERGYMEEVRRLAERLDERMALAQRDVWAVAIEAKVIKTSPDDLPF